MYKFQIFWHCEGKLPSENNLNIASHAWRNHYQIDFHDNKVIEK